MSAAPSLPDAAWQAVVDRDPRFDGKFVYAVRTTRVYCRPICPSRRPARRHVMFFAAPEAAAAAGFRPCKRCRPDHPMGPAVQEQVARARAYLDAHADLRISLDRLAEEVGLSPFHLQRAFKRIVGVSPRAYAAAARAHRLRSSLRSEVTVGRAVYEAGFNSSSSAYQAAPAAIGMTPAQYRRGGLGVRIRYTIVDSPVGRLLAGATDRGVAAVILGESDAAVEALLADEYPRAVRLRDDEGLAEWVDGVLRLLEGDAARDRLPVDVPATDFQLRVWAALRRIPFGTTRTYGEIAAELGAPGAARAVARACATNPIALVVPCHRVVREDGALGGYRWGIERKERLLAEESRGR
ncbi:MAG: bifunctional DNA-binding transcriptional regulator/O6-methylguanine-DNA methyltransferase Ada [Gemmatimonadota bacterium]